jgi:hypothetical protein
MKSYYCEKKSSKKCRAKVTLYPDGRKIQIMNHTCRKVDYEPTEEIHEYEELSDSTFKINGYSYKKMRGFGGHKTKNHTEFFTCVSKSKQRCRGSIHAKISNLQIVKQIGHTCGKASPIISQERPEPLATEDNPIEID